MEWIRSDININFIGMRFKAFVLSGILVLLSLGLVLFRGGLNLGVDFAGGILIQVQFQNPTNPGEIRDALKDLGFGQSAVQQVGAAGDHEYLIRTDVSNSELSNLSAQVEESLARSYGEGQVSVRRAEMVGPKVGHDLRQKALFAIYYSLLLIAVYISGRFEMKWAASGVMVVVLILGVLLLESLGMTVAYLIVGALLLTIVLCWVLKFPYALAAIMALLHDVLITVGAFALTNREFSLEVLAALLTIAGYSLNDTIVVFDRIRENLKKGRKKDFKELVNRSINQTLGRTILTGGTTLLALVFLFLIGGTVINDFAFAMLIGIVTGTYSSVYIASPLLIVYEDWTRGGRAPKRVAVNA
jgi:preprotein translocase subunit SecF